MSKYDLSLFKPFAKTPRTTVRRGLSNLCVIYTRVSTLRQMDGLSIEVQLKANSSYAEKMGWQVMGYFGGTHESAKTDERKEFKRMLDFVRKNHVGWIVVYSLERFSRNEDAIWQTAQLRKAGVEIAAATQPIDTSSPTGRLQQKVMFLFGEHDNELRRMKCVEGTKEHIMRGEWCNKPPVGYDSVKQNGERRIVVNAQGKFVRMAFQWKADKQLSGVEICKKLTAFGFPMDEQKLSKILHNPFYCGKIVHKFLDGQVVEGKQEKLISEELFLRANNMLGASKTRGYKIIPENEALPLKKFLRCDCCGLPMTGYVVKKKLRKNGKGYKVRNNPIYYYKCRTPQCKTNISARYLNDGFGQALQFYSPGEGEDMQTLIKQQMLITYSELSQNQVDEIELLEKNIKEIDSRLERLERRFVMEEINKELYDKYRSEFISEKIGRAHV